MYWCTRKTFMIKFNRIGIYSSWDFWGLLLPLLSLLFPLSSPFQNTFLDQTLKCKFYWDYLGHCFLYFHKRKLRVTVIEAFSKVTQLVGTRHWTSTLTIRPGLYPLCDITATQASPKSKTERLERLVRKCTHRKGRISARHMHCSLYLTVFCWLHFHQVS